MNNVSVFIIDDHKLFVEGLCSLLSDLQGFEIVGFSMNPVDFLEQVDQHTADVYLVDINMPQLSGVQLTGKMKEYNPNIKILALTMYDEYEYVEKMIMAGASGYILKSASIQELTHAIRTVAEGSKFLGSDIQELLFNKVEKSNAELFTRSFANNIEPDATLTKREVEILILISKELTTQQIAEELFISERTVETHRKNIFSKTKAKSVIGLSRYAEKNGYISV
ncbi:MAG: DNA-binding response regulator [Bacteroidetes bacterium HGW-Bacteroidetes-1]|jgi:DNA-binding NarL/FixJ family response regulator|nr:MAG: DNA-binding response regulator [Bacteroidetes bacterium HGW-Bacteroidetes-1]